MENISNRSLISQLYSAADQQMDDANYDVESWSEWYNAVQELSVPEKMVYVIVKLNQTVTSGGFVEFYESSYGVFAPEIAHALNEIKATESAQIVLDSMSIINPSGLLDNEYKGCVFNLRLTGEESSQLYSCDVRYDQLQGIENLEDLLGDYLQGVG